MKKFTSIMLSLILCIGMLTGCGKDYTASESTVFVLKNGKIVSTDVEDFSDTYDQASLEEYINKAIKTYTDENGEDAVKLNKLTVEDGKAVLILEYATTKDYMNFNGIELYAGTVIEALAAGYNFDVDFASVSDLKATACTKDEIIQSSDLKVVIYRGDVNLNVNGKIVYASVANTQLVDNSTIAIGPGLNLLGQAVEATTEAPEEVTETEEVSTEDTEAVEDMGSVDEDDLLAESTEEEEVTFEFKDDDTASDSSTTYSHVYTYVIYK